jgi:hypothetical protein
MKFKELCERTLKTAFEPIIHLAHGSLMLSDATMKGLFPLHGKRDTFKHTPLFVSPI